MNELPLISIIIRTCGRPHVLKHAIDSVMNQQYPNIEIVIVEDGSSSSEYMIKKEYPNLNYQYYYTPYKSGRTIVGNLGLSVAKGEFFNFLDDDDILLPEHVNTLVETLSNTNFKVGYSIAEEHQIKACSLKDKFIVKRKLIRYAQPYNRLLLCYMNYFPIQSVMFHRSLYETMGGFDESLDILEDWDLWLRYSTKENFIFIPKVTSVYYTPYKGVKKSSRNIVMKQTEKKIIEKYKSYELHLSAYDINQDMDFILNVFTKKGLLFYLKKLRDLIIYKDI